MSSPKVPFGAPMRAAHFAFSSSYIPLNHGSFGTHPTPVRAAHLALRAEADASPDPFIVYRAPALLAESRALAAKMLNTSTAELVFVPNATNGIDTVLKNMVWEEGDVIVCYQVIYSAVARGLEWLSEVKGVELEKLDIEWPIGDDELIERYIETVRRINREGKGRRRVRMAVCDTVISMPGLRVPFEKLVPALQKENALVMVDGAHGIGHIKIDLQKLKPDFFVTNIHKWLYVPRGCAALYVPKKHQWMIRTSLPTSLGFRPKLVEGQNSVSISNPLPGTYESEFTELFDFTGTIDNTNYLCVPAAIRFREEECGGEDTVQSYCQSIAYQAGDMAATLLGTEVMDHENSAMRQCAFSNVRLPLEVGDSLGQVRPEGAALVQDWIKTTSAKESGAYFQTLLYRGSWWWRISGQIYMEMADYERGTKILLDLCERVKKGEHAIVRANL